MKNFLSPLPLAATRLLSLAALLAGTSYSTAAGAMSQAEMAAAPDLGPVDTATPMSGMVWLKSRNEAQLDAAVASRYDVNSPFYHQWLSPAEVAGFGPAASDIQTLVASLRAQGLTIEHISDDGTAIKVSGTAERVGAAFGTSFHFKTVAGRKVFLNQAEPQYRGAHAELVDHVATLNGIGMEPFALRQVDPATGQPRAGVLATTPNPLSNFTNQCFGPSTTVTATGTASDGGTVVASYQGPQYLPDILFGPFCAYTAQQMVTHYGLGAVYAQGWTGKGQTIVLVDAFGSPTITADANTFSTAMGLPALTSKNFQIVYPDGQPPVASNTWVDEISLDVEWAHAIAPEAKIVLVVAPTDDSTELAYVLQYAVSHKLGTVISNSFGVPETPDTPAEPNLYSSPAGARQFNNIIKRAAAQGIAVNTATGDHGDYGVGKPLGAASVPADSQYGTAVGGTSLNVPSDKGPVDSAWGLVAAGLVAAGGVPIDPPKAASAAAGGGGGGGESIYLTKPAFQKNLPGTGRQLPDVSAVADPQTGAIIVMTENGAPTFSLIGGTSLASPVFSAIWALANQAAGEPLGQAAPIIANMASGALTDILPISTSNRQATPPAPS
ncbi:MAG: S53 family peptidase [Aliidongia sp.]